MLPGNTLIKKCSSCSTLLEEETIISGNTFGAVFWTDAKRDAPMLPETPWLVKCPKCKTLLWLNELENIGSSGYGTLGGDFEGAATYENVNSYDYINYLNENSVTKDKERYIRLRLWWLGNDKRREGDFVVFSNDEKSNLLSLLKLQELSNENDRLMMAEINRELGLFDEANTLLVYDFSEQLLPTKKIISDLVHDKKQFVTQVY